MPPNTTLSILHFSIKRINGTRCGCLCTVHTAFGDLQALVHLP